MSRVHVTRIARCGRVVVLCAIGWAATAAAQECHVTKSGLAENSGESWDLAMDLETAVGNPDCEVIRVATGFYYYLLEFTPFSGVEMYGGYEGVAGSGGGPGERNPALYPTQLALPIKFGPIGIWKPDTVLDGFNFIGDGGIQCWATDPDHECSLTLRNLDFNWSAGLRVVALQGGRVNLQVSDSTFRNHGVTNWQGGYGGAVSLVANDGGGVNARFTNVTFFNNAAWIGGAILANSADGALNLDLEHATFVGNAADSKGGAISSEGTGASVRILNSIIWGNTAPQHPSIFAAGAPAALHAVVSQDGCNPATMRCHIVTTADPQLGPLQDNGGYTQTMMPALGGSAIDFGVAANCPGHDQRGIARPAGSACDVGAVENNDPIYRGSFEP